MKILGGEIEDGAGSLRKLKGWCAGRSSGNGLEYEGKNVLHAIPILSSSLSYKHFSFLIHEGSLSAVHESS